MSTELPVGILHWIKCHPTTFVKKRNYKINHMKKVIYIIYADPYIFSMDEYEDMENEKEMTYKELIESDRPQPLSLSLSFYS